MHWKIKFDLWMPDFWLPFFFGDKLRLAEPRSVFDAKRKSTKASRKSHFKRNVHNRTSLIANNASLRNYYSRFSKPTTKNAKNIFLILAWKFKWVLLNTSVRSSFYFDGCKPFMVGVREQMVSGSVGETSKIKKIRKIRWKFSENID